MNKSMTFARYHLSSVLRSVGVYYLVFLTAMLLVNFLVATNEGSSSSGMEIAGAVFLFVTGLCAFRENFYFAQANNITRKTFFRGLVLSIPPLCVAMSLIDLLINRLLNLFIPNVMLYDMIFSGFGKPQLYAEDLGSYLHELQRVWYPSSDIGYIFTGLLWSFVIYCAAFYLGLMVTLIYYRANTWQKVLVSLVPVALLYVGSAIPMMPNTFLAKTLRSVVRFLAAAFGSSALLSSLSFTVLCLIFIGVAFLLARRAVVKKS